MRDLLKTRIDDRGKAYAAVNGPAMCITHIVMPVPDSYAQRDVLDRAPIGTASHRSGVNRSLGSPRTCWSNEWIALLGDVYLDIGSMGDEPPREIEVEVRFL